MAVCSPDRHDPARSALLRGRIRGVPVLRPPWALDESRFVEACSGCGDCVAACPQQVLVRAAGGLPAFDPRLGECTFCGDCAGACGEAAFGSRDAPAWTVQARFGDACLAANGIVCSSCRDACGEAAIAFPLRRSVPVPQLVDARCTGCGACVPACPAGAISLAAGLAQGVPVDA